MKISIIGAGNVGALSAMRIAHYNLGDIFLVDIAKGLAQGKSLDLADAQAVLGLDYNIQGSEDISSIKDSAIVVITAGLARKPGMTREQLLAQNSQILKEVCVNIREFAPQSVVIVVTNPLDLMTYLALKTTGFARNKVLGMGSSLDSSRLANLIAQELKLPATSVETMVIGTHGEGMLPLARHTKIKEVSLEEFLNDEQMEGLTKRTTGRGAEIVALLGSGSAFFAPSAAVAQMVKIIAKDEKKITGACAYLDGEYGIKDICLGVPCRLGRAGIEKIIELDLADKEKKELLHSADAMRDLLKQLPV
ncbi:MAG: malate dehydrogenase [Candidatus Omnitrophota bacterium]|jgi:malate dehydrogenase